MPSPTYLLAEIKSRKNVAVGNDEASEAIVLSFQPVDLLRSKPGSRPLIGPEGGFDIIFDSLEPNDNPRLRAKDFELGKLYRLVSVEDLP